MTRKPKARNAAQVPDKISADDLHAYLETLDSRCYTTPQPDAGAEFLYSATATIANISIRELRKNSKLRYLAKEFLKDLCVMETYLEEKDKYAQSLPTESQASFACGL